MIAQKLTVVGKPRFPGECAEPRATGVGHLSCQLPPSAQERDQIVDGEATAAHAERPVLPPTAVSAESSSLDGGNSADRSPPVSLIFSTAGRVGV